MVLNILGEKYFLIFWPKKISKKMIPGAKINQIKILILALPVYVLAKTHFGPKDPNGRIQKVVTFFPMK